MNNVIDAARVELERRRRELDAQTRFSSIVESSGDAIVSKDIDGIILTWNAGAERLFGYPADEIVGRHVRTIIPKDRQHEEDEILRRIRAGERIDHFETVRRRKDGSLVDISLSISPVRNAEGKIVGASKIARDIGDRKRTEEQQELLLREMSHRVKNVFALANSVCVLSARASGVAEEAIQAIQARLGALARAHDLTLPSLAPGESRAETPTTLRALIQAIVAPHERKGSFSVEGPDFSLAGGSLSSLALLFHESTTNAVKHGALSSPTGRIEIEWRIEEGDLLLSWTESGGPRVQEPQGRSGFGSTLSRAAITQLGGALSLDWRPEGLRMNLATPMSGLVDDPACTSSMQSAGQS